MRDSESVSFCSVGKSSVLNKHIIITDTSTCDRVSQVIYCLADLTHWAKLRPKDVFLKSLQTLKRRPLRSQNESSYDVFFLTCSDRPI